MLSNHLLRVVAVFFAAFCLLAPACAESKPEDELAGTLKLILSKNFVADWQGVERLPGVRWAPLPPTMLQNCLPDGGCFSRQGMLAVGGRELLVIATGARTMVTHIYFRNAKAPIGEAALVAALKQRGVSLDLARCPVQRTIGGTNWYRLRGASLGPGFLSIQTSCNGKACEGFALSFGDELPRLQPNQLALYSESCSEAGGGERKPVATVMPHEQLAQVFAAFPPTAAGPALYDWKTLAALSPGVKWIPGGMKFGSLSGQLMLSQREFSVNASGAPAQIKAISFDEMGLHPRGEDLLGALRRQGFEVRLSRCGPIYTESTNNWYSVTSAKTRPVMLRQSIRMDGRQVQDAYEMRLDNSLPKRDPRDRDPGVNGCR